MKKTISRIKDLKDLPWKRDQVVTLTKKEAFEMIKYIQSTGMPIRNFLEFGCGVSTHFLSQLNFENYVAVEEYQPTIDNVSRHCPNVVICKRWVDIPKRKYDFVFVDSHTGGNARRHQRYKPFEYAILNDLLSDSTIMIAHDHTMVDKGDFSRLSVEKGWHGYMNKYKWTLVDQIRVRKNLGIYKHTEHTRETYLSEYNPDVSGESDDKGREEQEMSFEGYYQILCENGHHRSEDVYMMPDEDKWRCDICGAKLVWTNTVDLTNGTWGPNEERIDGYIELEVKDPERMCVCEKCGNEHVSEAATYHIPDQ